MQRRSRMLLTLAVAGAVGCHRQSSNLVEPTPRPASTQSGAPSISTDQPAQPSTTQAEELLEGRFAGVDVARTASGGFLIRIRGTTTLMGSQEPLYVINGVAVQIDPERGLDWLNPAEIHRIEVIKDGAELAFYGARGANGVIRITTKGHH